VIISLGRESNFLRSASFYGLAAESNRKRMPNASSQFPVLGILSRSTLKGGDVFVDAPKGVPESKIPEVDLTTVVRTRRGFGASSN
jgi:hypothetical protein